MKVAGNKVKHIADLYFSELKAEYSQDEIQAILATMFDHYLGFKRNEWMLKADENINQSDLIKLYKCYEELKSGRPLQYILNEAWFYNLKFYVDENVLIPRPETEELVEIILKENSAAHSFLDIGTGSGCIPVSIKYNKPDAEVSACDISPAALAVAKRNSEANKLQINFFEADALDTNQLIKKAGNKFDVIISNPPYVKLSEKRSLNRNVVEHEPALALFVGEEDDIVFYKRIIDACAELLKKHGKLYFELNPITATDVKQYAEQSGLFANVGLIKDISGNLRFIRGDGI